MPSSIITLNPRNRITLREAYRSALADGYNATVEVGRYDQASAQTMIGFLSAASIALRLAGDEVWAAIFDRSAKRLNENWRCYEGEIPALASALDSAGC